MLLVASHRAHKRILDFELAAIKSAEGVNIRHYLTKRQSSCYQEAPVCTATRQEACHSQAPRQGSFHSLLFLILRGAAATEISSFLSPCPQPLTGHAATKV